MKRLSFLLLLCAIVSVASAQKITQTFQNVPLSDALKYIQEQATDYSITFIYDELEDFRVTTDIQNKSIPDAILQIVGFYPVRVVKSGKHEIYVECTHKTDRHLTGTVIDENRQPVPYANVYLLHPSDSTVIGGGVSNEAGVFVIPYELPKVLVRISYVGYKTVYRLCSNEQVGTIQMKPETMTIKGVVVNGERPKVQLQGNSLVMNVEGTVMERMGTAEDVLSRVPTISKKGDVFEILGKGVPLIYLNNRKLTDLQELKNIQSDNIKNVEVIQNPGARYDASVNAVIIIRTKRMAGEGLGVELTSWSRKDRGYVNNERVNLTYRTGRLELFANLFGAYNKKWSRSEFEQTVFADTLWVITNREEEHVRNPFLEGRFGFNYQLNDNNSFGGFYQNTYDYMKVAFEDDDNLLANGSPYDHLQNSSNGSPYDHLQNSSIKRAEGVPKHQVNLYYTGKIGKLSIDFNADYTYRNQRNRNQQQELSDEYDDRDVSTYALTRSRLMAEKLFVTHPIGKGQIEVGEEYTNTRWNSSFENKEGYIANSNNEQHEQAIAPFIELRQQIGRHNVNAMIRWMWIYLNTNFSHCVDPILYTAESLESDSKVNLVTYKNYDHLDWLVITLGAQKDIKLGHEVTWTPQYNISLMKPWLKAEFLGEQKSFSQPMLSLQLGNIVTFPHDWLVQADFNMHTHGNSGANANFDCTNPILSLSVSKDFCKRRLNIKLSGNDLFNGGINRFTLYSNRMMFRKMEDNDSRCVTLSLRYRFNVTPSKYKGTGAGNAEKNRL